MITELTIYGHRTGANTTLLQKVQLQLHLEEGMEFEKEGKRIRLAGEKWKTGQLPSLGCCICNPNN